MKFFRRSGLIDSILLAILVVVLIEPLFRLKYLDNWPSIESTFIADARMLSEHLPHPGWQPLWYCGTRTDYIYPPALRYGTVLISQLGHVLPARAYHLYTAVFYVLGILAVYWLVRIGSGSRVSAWLASTAMALLSPSFLLLPSLKMDSGFLVPQRLHALMTYGEGPHMSALAVLPAALALSLVALRRQGAAALAGAAALCALVVANNFYGATALAILYPILVWSVWVGERRYDVWWRAAAIPALAWGLSAFWLTPSYLHITLVNLKWVAQPANSSGSFLLGAAAFYALFSWAVGSGRPERIWQMFVYGAAFLLGTYVLGFYYFNLRVIGEPARLVPELDLAIILAFVETVRILWFNRRLRIPLALLVLVAYSPATRYLKHAWSPFPSAPAENAFQYKTAGWVRDHLSGARVLPVGTVRFWFDAWSDNAQPDGGSMQGMLNQIIPVATWQILVGERADLATLWLQALGTDAAIVPAKASQEPYHDYQHPDKFRGALPLLHDDGQGTNIYGVPRVHPGIVRVVDHAAIAAVARISGGDDNAALAKYVGIVENPASPAGTIEWQSFDAAQIHATTTGGQSVLVQETWDPAWHAYESGREVPLRVEDKMGFMLIDAPPGTHSIRMQFEKPLENRAGGIVFLLTSILLVGLMAKRRIL
jgi:hypothetical protein